MKRRSIVALTAALMSICICTQPLQMCITAADTETAVVSEMPTSDEMSEAAVSKMNDLNVLFALFAGAPAYTEKTDDTTTNGLLLKVTDERFPTLDKLKDFINSTCCFEAKEHFESQLTDCFVEKDGALYVKRKLMGFYIVPISEGVTISRTAQVEFTAVTQIFSAMNGYCKADFYKDSDGNWSVENFEFIEFDERLEHFALTRINDIAELLDFFNGSSGYTDETEVTIDGDKYEKVVHAKFLTVEDIRNAIMNAATGELYIQLIDTMSKSIIEKDCAVYVRKVPKLDYWFDTNNGIKLGDVTDIGFTATTVNSTGDHGQARFFLEKSGGDWLISGYEFGDYSSETKSAVCEKLKALNVILGVMNAAPAYVDSEDFIMTDGDKSYVRVTNAPFTTYDEFKSYVSSTTASPLSDTLIEQAGSSFIIENGNLYVENKGVSFPIFNTKEGVELKDETDASLTVHLTAIDELYGKKDVYFVKLGDNWLIKSYETGVEEGDLHKIAAQKMDDLSTIFAIMNASPQYTEPVNDEYAKITDERFNTLYDFHVLVESTVYGDLRNDILVESSEAFRDIDGSLCVKRTGRSFYIFRTQDGVELSDTTRSAFTATTVADDQLYGKGTANFIWKDNDWFITDYRFGDEQPALPLGDTNGDSKIDAKDASFVLVEYSKMSTGADSELTKAQKEAADVNNDGKIDAKDSSFILSYYAFASTAAGDVPTLKEYMTPKEN